MGHAVESTTWDTFKFKIYSGIGLCKGILSPSKEILSVPGKTIFFSFFRKLFSNELKWEQTVLYWTVLDVEFINCIHVLYINSPKSVMKNPYGI